MTAILPDDATSHFLRDLSFGESKPFVYFMVFCAGVLFYTLILYLCLLSGTMRVAVQVKKASLSPKDNLDKYIAKITSQR